jgi:hypothetical protein
MLLEARKDMPLSRFYLLAVLRDVLLACLMSLLKALSHLLTMRLALWREFVNVFPQALCHAPASRLDVCTEFLHICAAGSFVGGGERGLHNQSARNDHRWYQQPSVNHLVFSFKTLLTKSTAIICRVSKKGLSDAAENLPSVSILAVLSSFPVSMIWRW